jgi:hypothetical protein
MVYNGKEDETLVETRVRLYKALKTKSCESIPPDPDSLSKQFIEFTINFTIG